MTEESGVPPCLRRPPCSPGAAAGLDRRGQQDPAAISTSQGAGFRRRAWCGPAEPRGDRALRHDLSLPAASVTASTFSPEESSSTTMVCTVPAGGVTGMAACWPAAANRTVRAPGDTAVYDVATQRKLLREDIQAVGCSAVTRCCLSEACRTRTTAWPAGVVIWSLSTSVRSRSGPRAASVYAAPAPTMKLVVSAGLLNAQARRSPASPPCTDPG